MSELRRFDLETLLERPGTYVNPQTEMVVVVDDSAHVDAELLGGGGDWILVSDEVPVDSVARDELIDALETRARRSGGVAPLDHDLDDEDELGGEDELDEHGFSTGRLDEDDDDY